jgi:hypothetical protein
MKTHSFCSRAIAFAASCIWSISQLAWPREGSSPMLLTSMLTLWTEFLVGTEILIDRSGMPRVNRNRALLPMAVALFLLSKAMARNGVTVS